MDTEIEKMDIPVSLVDRVRAALSGYPDQLNTKNSRKTVGKIDGRTKAFRTTIRRIEARKHKINTKNKGE